MRPILGDGLTPNQGIAGQHRVLVLSTTPGSGISRGSGHHRPGASTWARPPLPRRRRHAEIACVPLAGNAVYGVRWRWCRQTLANRSLHFLTVVGRRRPGVTIAQAQADMDAIAARQQAAFPATNAQRGVTLVPLTEQIVGEVRRPLYVLAAAVLMVLLIGCANVGNLMLIRASARRRELAIRVALGADRLRLARQLVVEALALAGAGAVAGLVLAAWATSLLSRVAARRMSPASPRQRLTCASSHSWRRSRSCRGCSSRSPLC